MNSVGNKKQTHCLDLQKFISGSRNTVLIKIQMIHNGLSGCKLEIIDSGILRKYSSSSDYNKRLLKQINKQILFSKLTLKNINAPKVLATQCGQLYSFDMEYIPGLSSYEYFSSVNVCGIEFVIQTLFDYFDRFSNNVKEFSINNKIIEKILCK